MAVCKLVVFAVALTAACKVCNSIPPTPPLVERPILLDSFLPAGMQIIAHLTDLMKYDLRPGGGASSPGPTTTARPPSVYPTPSHAPAVFAPQNPPGPAAYYSRGTSYAEYVQRLKNPEGFSYFDRYKYPVEDYESERGRRVLNWDSTAENEEQAILSSIISELRNQKSLPDGLVGDVPATDVDDVPQTRQEKALHYSTHNENVPEELELLGAFPSDIIKQINKVEDFDFIDDDDQVQRFSKNYDDSDFRFYLAGARRSPPTRAYVTFLSLYDMLNKESKKLMLNKYGGFTDDVLKTLEETSLGSAEDQVKTVLSKIVQRHDTKDQQTITKINTLLKEMETPSNYLSDALRYLPPLQYAH